MGEQSPILFIWRHKMLKLSVNIQDAMVIPVKNAIRAKKGDYLFISDDGKISIVDKKTYTALKSIGGNTSTPKQSSNEEYIVKRQVKAPPQTAALRKRVHNTLQKSEGGALTGEIINKINGRPDSSRGFAHDKNSYNRVYHALEWLNKHGMIEFIDVETGPGGINGKSTSRLWSVVKQCNSLSDKREL
jgi:hypothetical protein